MSPHHPLPLERWCTADLEHAPDFIRLQLSEDVVEVLRLGLPEVQLVQRLGRHA